MVRLPGRRRRGRWTASTILELFFFIARKMSRDDFARKRELNAVTRLVFPFVGDKKMTGRISTAALTYAHSKRRAGRR